MIITTENLPEVAEKILDMLESHEYVMACNDTNDSGQWHDWPNLYTHQHTTKERDTNLTERCFAICTSDICFPIEPGHQIWFSGKRIELRSNTNRTIIEVL